VNDQPIFVPAEIEDHSVVANEINGVAELPLYLGRPRRASFLSEIFYRPPSSINVSRKPRPTGASFDFWRP
jgi:hypothetical protein